MSTSSDPVRLLTPLWRWIRFSFWNDGQYRLRTLWRILLLIVLFIAIFASTGYVLGAITFAVALAAGTAHFGDPFVTTVNGIVDNSTALTVLSYFIDTARWIVLFWVAGRVLDRRAFKDFGLHLGPTWWRDLAFGLSLGGLMLLVIFTIERAAGWITITGTFSPGSGSANFGIGLGLAVLGFIDVGIREELQFRGYLLKNLSEMIPVRWRRPGLSLAVGWLLSSTLFGVAHLGNPEATPIAALNIFVVGIILALPYVLTGELAIPIGIHITWNLFETNVFGFPVSGFSGSPTVIAIKQGGPDLWTGGGFGPEAGLVVFPALLIGTLLILVWIRIRDKGLHWQTSLAIPPTREVTPGETLQA